MPEGKSVQSMFSGISGRYDFANHFLSGGIDYYWRHRLVKAVAAHKPAAVADLATGSGDVALALRRKLPPECPVQGRDLSPLLLKGERLTSVPVYLELDYRGRVKRGVVAEGRKLIVSRSRQGDRIERYDLRHDTHEKHDLGNAVGPAWSPTVSDLKAWHARSEALGTRLVESAGDKSPLVLDAKTNRQLRQLGYLEKGPPATQPSRSRKR